MSLSAVSQNIFASSLSHCFSRGDRVDILAAVKRTAIPHHATFLEWSLNGVDASRDAASLTEV
ncbi:MAG: hypothetical protein GPJ02_23025, partial [Microcystis aeruginosa G13-12]|nr:hypothetical protein [Microcystis aeruginosa SX13-11]NCS18195.1 hypothetical protein [Microcystis aeruginosa G13-12]NCT53778.1 hypothetical protein [Microcystis aeruginosa G13-03]